MRLELGCGKQAPQFLGRGIITIDATPPADYVATIPPLPDEILAMGPIFESIRGMHFWEHLYHWQAVELAKQIYGILEPGGSLILEMPNLAKAAQHLIDGEENPRLTMWAIYGAQTDPKWAGNIHMTHKWGYTPATIRAQLLDAGFSKVEILPARTRLPGVRDMRVQAYV